MAKHTIMSAALSAVSVAALAQTDSLPAARYGMFDCMQYAVQHSVSVRSRALDVEDARADRRAAILSAFVPSVSGSAYANTSFGRAIDPETNTYSSTTMFYNGYSLSADIALFNGLSAVSKMRVSKTAVLMGRNAEQQELDAVCLATMEAFCSVVYCSDMIGVLSQKAANTSALLAAMQRKYELGQKGRADVVQLEADLADDEYALAAMRNSLTDAYRNLVDLMMWPATDTLLIDATVPEATVLPEGNAHDIISRAQQSLPKAVEAQGAVDKAQHELTAARWSLAPSVYLSGGWSTTYYTYPGMAGYKAQPFADQFRNNGGEYVQVNMSIPIFSGLRRQANIVKQRNAYDRAIAERERTQHQIASEVMRALHERDGAKASYQQALKREAVQNEAYAFNTKKVEQGLISTLEYQTAQVQYLKAKAEKIDAYLKYQIKCRIVEYYNGISYLNQQ